MSHVEALLSALPVVDPEEVARARGQVDARPIRYPLGSGQGEELALAAGLRPLIRQLLDAPSLERARERFERAGFSTGVAPRVYGPTHDGWDDTPEPLAADAPGARRALFVGRDGARIEEAIGCDLAKTDEADRELGRLLGYPRCCVEAFVETSRERRNVELYAAALTRTRARPHPRLNGLDLGVFHYVSWAPCAYDCALSLAYADAVASRLARRHAPFVARIDAALATHRLVLLDEVQISLEGRLFEGDVAITSARPTAQDRHPSAGLPEDAREATARALALVRRASRVRVTPSGLELDGVAVPGTEGALLVPFGAPRSVGAPDRELVLR